MSLPAFSHHIWVGCFFATGQYGNVDHTGTCEVLIRTTYSEMVRARPVFSDLESAVTVPSGQLLGVYTSAVEGGMTDPAIADAIAYADARGVPALIYVDQDDYPQEICDEFLNDVHGNPIPSRIPVVRGYPAAKLYGDPLVATPAEDVARIRATVATLRSVYDRVALAHTYYTQWVSGPGTENYPLSHILAMQPGLAQLERDYQVFASLGFAMLRPSGMTSYPELLAAYDDEVAASVTPSVTPPSVVWVPEATVPTGPPVTFPMRRVRQSPHIWDGEQGFRVGYPGFELIAEVGSTRDDPAEPNHFELQYSDDGGWTWSQLRVATGDQFGQYLYRYRWLRLGHGRDRIFRVVNSDSAKIVLIEALLEPDPVPGHN